MSMRPEQIPYGVKDFKRIRLEGRYYVDKTAYIRKLEARAQLRAYAADPALPTLAGGTPVHFICYELRGRDLVRLEEIPEKALRDKA